MTSCASYRNVLDGAQLSCLILCHLLESFLYSVKRPFRDFHFISDGVFLFFPLFTFQGDEALLHHSVRAISVIATFHLLQVLSGWRFQLPLTLYSCLPSFFGLLSKPLCSFSFLAKMPTLFFSYHFPNPSTVRLVHRELSPLPICQCFSPFAFRETRCNVSVINW